MRSVEYVRDGPDGDPGMTGNVSHARDAVVWPTGTATASDPRHRRQDIGRASAPTGRGAAQLWSDPPSTHGSPHTTQVCGEPVAEAVLSWACSALHRTRGHAFDNLAVEEDEHDQRWNRDQQDGRKQQIV